MNHRLFATFLIVLAGCEGANQAPRLPVRSDPGSLPVMSGPTVQYRGKCGCGCGSFACLYGNCGKGGIPACCTKCTCIKTTIHEINKSANEILKKVEHEELNQSPKVKLLDPVPFLPGPSDSQPKVANKADASPIRKWYRVSGRPGLWGYGVLSDKQEIVDISHWYQDPTYPKW